VSIYLNLSGYSQGFLNSQISRLQQIENSLARAVVKAPKFSHSTPIYTG